MYCNQCEQTAKGIACTTAGVCGKNNEVASLQDLLLLVVSEMAEYAHQARQRDMINNEINRFTLDALFATLTNVNFDPACFQEYINKAVVLREQLKDRLTSAGVAVNSDNLFSPAGSLDELIKQAETIGLPIDQAADEDIRSLQQILIYGLKGVAAYAHHAFVLGEEDDKIYAFTHEALDAIRNRRLTLGEWLDLVLKCGEINLLAMELLDAGNTSSFGHPQPTEVPLGPKEGKAILVSGHDLKDLKDLLIATEGRGINIYTHGEMIPAHGYPELKKYPHFYGHYGTAWQNQRKEFSSFPGPILMTTNCIQEPREVYFSSIFTTGPVGWPGVKHLPNGQFEELIETALAMPGFTETRDEGTVMCGFGHNAVLGVADAIVAAVKAGKIKHFFLVGGCDGAKTGRNYFTEFVEKTPADSVILTLGCGKYRFFDQQLGDIDGIPRLLDVGQCNDAYSAVQIALALADAFECGVNDLPLSLVISWYEQKAVSVLLSLLHLGIKNIRLGPTLPAFITPNVLDVLVANYGLKAIATAEEDLRAILA